MNESIKKALEYVRNTNGGATVGDFLDDWEPIGHALWRQLMEPVELVKYNDKQRLVLTEEGKKALKESL